MLPRQSSLSLLRAKFSPSSFVNLTKAAEKVRMEGGGGDNRTVKTSQTKRNEETAFTFTLVGLLLLLYPAQGKRRVFKRVADALKLLKAVHCLL